MNLKLLTIQHKDVLKQLLEGKIFYADIKRVPENRVTPYQDMMLAYHWDNCPIFAGVVGKRSEFYGARTNDSVMIELAVPEEEVKLQNYYNWSDIIYYLEERWEWGGSVTIEEFEQQVLTQTQFKKEEVIQATINRIEPMWLFKYTDSVSKKFVHNHYGSGGRNVLKDITKY